MNYKTLTQDLNELFLIEDWVGRDSSKNGLQIQPAQEEIRKVALAVDASQSTFDQAVAAGVEMLIVHHGLFWRENLMVTQMHYQRLKTLIEAGCGLYAVHLPMDGHAVLGHNAQMAALLNLKGVEPLSDVGWQGNLPVAMKLQEVIAQFHWPETLSYRLLNFGSEDIFHIGILAGAGGSQQFMRAAKDNQCDLYITGEISHTSAIFAKEAQMNVLAAGHYWTERYGLLALQEYLQRNMALETVWIEEPTGF